MKRKTWGLMAAMPVLAICLACSSQRNANNDVSYKDHVKQALEQAELKDVTVSEDQDKNTITLGGMVHSDSAKAEAANITQSAASSRVVVNQISVQPVGAESQAKDIASNLDDGIENNYKAVLIAKGLDQEDISFDAKNGVLTLKGTVKAAPHRQEAQQLAKSIPNVQQVVNEIEVKR